MKNIYVGNLNVAVTEDEVRGLFQAYGAVATVTLVKDRDTSRSRGFAFVEMPNDGEAEAAINALNGTPFGQQPLTVNEARSKHESLNGKAAVEQRKHSRETLPTRTHRQHRY
jgi:RNA recognition motif-containing protein